MQTIPVTYSLLTFLGHLEFTEAALSADPDTVDFAPAFTAAMAEWDGIFAKERTSRRDVIRAEAVVSVRDAHLDRNTMEFAGYALAEAKNDRKSQKFRRFFRESPSGLVRSSLRKQCQQTLEIIVVELGKLPDTSLLKPYLGTLQDLAQRAVEALDSRVHEKAQRAIAKADVDDWKEGVNRLRRTTYAEILKIAVEKDYSKEWVASFFMGTSSKSEPEPEPEPEPGPGGGEPEA